MYSSISVAPSTSLKLISPSLATNRKSWPPHRLTVTQCSLPLTATTTTTTTTKTALSLPNSLGFDSASNLSLASLTNQPLRPSLTIERPEANDGGGGWTGGGRGSTGGGGDDKDHVFDDDDELFGWVGLFGLPRFYARRLWRRLKWNLLAKMSADPGLPRKLLWEALSSAAWSLFFDIVRNFFNDESSERPAVLLLANAGAEALCGVYIMLNFAPSICFLASASIGRNR